VCLVGCPVVLPGRGDGFPDRWAMALVVLLKGVNVGGHRRFRPRLLAAALRRYEVVNVGAAGTFIVRARVSRAELRAEFARRLPFETDVMICGGHDILRLVAGDPFADQPSGPATLQFVSILARSPRAPQRLPFTIPSSGRWCVKVFARRHRFVF